MLAAVKLIDLAELRRAYYEIMPDPSDPQLQVVFGTSGHRGSALTGSFNEAHIAAVCVAVAEYRADQGWRGPLFIGADTHALSEYALATAADTLKRCGVRVLVSKNGEYVPTPAISHAIIKHNRYLTDPAELADGIIITPSHNPPQDGGIKYNPPHGGPADTDATAVIEVRACELLQQMAGGSVQQWLESDLPKAVAVADRPEISEHDFLSEYVTDLANVIDFEVIKNSGLRFAAHPLGGAATAYWPAIAERYGLDLTVLGPGVEKTWAFMTPDWDGKIRMDPSSEPAMGVVLEYQQQYPLIVANDADADRHGIVTGDHGLMNPNHFLAVCVDYLLRRAGGGSAKIGKTIVSSAIISRVAAAHSAEVFEVPVGFKWFVPGLSSGELIFAGEESAGASLLTAAGEPWSTDKDGIALGLLAAEIYAATGKSPSEYYRELVAEHGESAYGRIDMPATAAQKARLKRLAVADINATELGGDKIVDVLTAAPANNAPFGGVIIRTAQAWAAIRPSGTENVMKVYAESFNGPEHLQQVQQEATRIMQTALEGAE